MEYRESRGAGSGDGVGIQSKKKRRNQSRSEKLSQGLEYTCCFVTASSFSIIDKRQMQYKAQNYEQRNREGRNGGGDCILHAY